MIKFPPFPIVSTPVDANAVQATSYDVQSLIDATLQGICAAPTPQVPPRSL